MPPLAPPQGLPNAPKILGWYNVKNYGADPTGTADSTTAFANFTAAVGSTGTGVIPVGTYSLTALPTFESTATYHFAPGSILLLNGVPQNRLSYYHAAGTDYNVLQETFASWSAETTTGSMTSGSNALTLAAAKDFAFGQGIYVANAAKLPEPSAPKLSQASGSSSFNSGDTVYAGVALIDGSGNYTLASVSSISISATGNTVSFSQTVPEFCQSIGVYAATASGPKLLGTITNTGTITYSGSSSSGLSVSVTGNVLTVTISAIASSTGSTEPSSNATQVPLTGFVGTGAGTTSLTVVDSSGAAVNAAYTVSDEDVYHDDTAAIQAAIDAAHDVNGLVISPAATAYFTQLTLWGVMTFRGASMDTTSFNRLPGATSACAVREKTAAEGNGSGAGALWVTDLRIDGNSTPGDGLNLGNQVSGNQLNFNASVAHVYVEKFTSGTQINLNCNAVRCSYLWGNNGQTGINLSGGSSMFYGVWGEGNSQNNVVVGGVAQMLFGVQTEGNNADYAPILVAGDANLLAGIVASLGADAAKVVELKGGGTGVNNTIIHLVVLPNGYTITDSIFDDAWGNGSGDTTTVGFWFPVAGGDAGFLYDKTTGHLSTLNGTTWTAPVIANFTPATESLAGTSAGSVVWVQDQQGTVKRLVAYLDAYENTTATAQTITLPKPFSNTPAITSQPSGFGATVSTTTLTLPASMSAAVSGVIEVVGI